MDIIEDITNKKTTFSNNISDKLDIASNIKDIITDEINININLDHNNINNNIKPNIHANESLHEFIDNHFSLTFLLLLISSIIFGSFYIFYSIMALYNTPHYSIIKLCPENYIWFYLLYSFSITKFFYYLCLKGGLLLDNKRNCTYFVYAFLITNIIPIPFGYNYIFTNCINNNFKNKLIITMSTIDIYMQVSFTFISIFYIIWRFYRKCPLYIKNNNNIENKKEIENNREGNGKNNREGNGESNGEGNGE